MTVPLLSKKKKSRKKGPGERGRRLGFRGKFSSKQRTLRGKKKGYSARLGGPV